jgi:hypothetical protein
VDMRSVIKAIIAFQKLVYGVCRDCKKEDKSILGFSTLSRQNLVLINKRQGFSN